MIRVLVCDDSPTSRALLVEILRRDAGVQVVGEATDGQHAVELTQTLRPSLVTMDIHMPRMDGMAATKEIMITAPTPVVIVTGSTENREVELAMQALRAGALAVLRKPPGPAAPAFEEAAQEFLSTVKGMATVKVVRHWRPQTPARPRLPPAPGIPPCVVAIAASTGGPAALHRLFSELPGTFPAPILVVQHISNGFTAGLAEWLNSTASLRVKVAQAGEPLRPQTVYIAPDDEHLGVTRGGAVLLAAEPGVNGFRPSASFLFESLGNVCGSGAVAVILTGMGDDGVAGLRKVRETGGAIIAQDEKSSVVFGMPGAAVAAGLADLVLPLDQLAVGLQDLVAARLEKP